MPGSSHAAQTARRNRMAQRPTPSPPVEEDHEFEVDLRELSYRELQKLAMSRGINASGSKVNLYSRLAEA